MRSVALVSNSRSPYSLVPPRHSAPRFGLGGEIHDGRAVWSADEGAPSRTETPHRLLRDWCNLTRSGTMKEGRLSLLLRSVFESRPSRFCLAPHCVTVKRVSG